MRQPSPQLLRQPFVALPLALSIALAAAPAAIASETTRTLKLDMAPTGSFVVENLAGSMRVSAGSSDKIVAVATVHGENDQVADSVRFEQVTGEKGVPTLRVIYPTDRYTTFRYPRNHDADHSDAGSWLSGWFGGSSSSVKYDGHKVKISDGSGVLLYADVEVQLPRHAVEGVLRNLVGRIDAEGVEGTLKFDTASGDVTIDRSKGDLSADTGSGDVKASDLEGSFAGDTGSGDIDLSGFSGEKIKCGTGSGDVSIASGKARKIAVSTGSGDVHLKDVEASEIAAGTGSGNVTIDAQGDQLEKVKADTGSGNVTLRLGSEASFEAMASLGSGEIVNHYRDAQPILKDKEIVGYRRGSAHTSITVGTGSGDFVLEPGTI